MGRGKDRKDGPDKSRKHVGLALATALAVTPAGDTDIRTVPTEPTTSHDTLRSAGSRGAGTFSENIEPGNLASPSIDNRGKKFSSAERGTHERQTSPQAAAAIAELNTQISAIGTAAPPEAITATVADFLDTYLKANPPVEATTIEPGPVGSLDSYRTPYNPFGDLRSGAARVHNPAAREALLEALLKRGQ
ncbi:hypothetical protein A2635_00535 [Candidatus Peribacteria bacterium RIFCSPHIGHO2_01_FULL_51_9]|nr:MAG: hypothetical protein A2635_00535 [Candidatus Peribacteria bacterium RIFCSPHIGHO2_01_FULL_51_9]